MIAVILAGAIAMGLMPAARCTVTDPNTIRDKCDLHCRYEGNTPVCWWVAKPEQRT